MYHLQAKLLALAFVASGAELGTNDRGLSNASDEVQGLFVRESNASTVCGVDSSVDVRGCARVAVLITAGFHNIVHGMNTRFDGKLINASHPLMSAWLRTTAASLRRHQVPLAPASRLGRQLLRLVVGVRYKILSCVVYGIPPVPRRVFSSATSSASDS